MNKTDIKNEMVKFVGGGLFIRKYQLAQFMGFKDPNTCRRYLAGLEKVSTDFYYIPDVAQSIAEKSEVN